MAHGDARVGAAAHHTQRLPSFFSDEPVNCHMEIFLFKLAIDSALKI
jgi:hypothetical protein